MFFVDDNIARNPHYCKELCKRLSPYNKKWFGFAAVPVIEDEKLLRLLANSGCNHLFLGFESLSRDSLNEVNKFQNKPQNYGEVVRKLRDYGIEVNGSFIFGFDHDDKGVFDRAIKFIYESKIDMPIIKILTPYPGMSLYNRLKKEGRLLKDHWWLERFYHNDIHFKSKPMSITALREGFELVAKEIYSFRFILSNLKRDYKYPIIHRYKSCVFSLYRRRRYSKLTHFSKHLTLRY